MWNTIRLLKGQLSVDEKHLKNFSHGDTICGLDAEPQEIERYSIGEKDEAAENLAKYKCEYWKGAELYYWEEYALEYCNTDEDGDFISGSDYDFAEGF